METSSILSPVDPFTIVGLVAGVLVVLVGVSEQTWPGERPPQCI